MLTTFSRSPARSTPSIEVGDVHLWFANVYGELHNLIHATVTKIYPLTGEYDERPWHRVYYGGFDHPGMLKGVRSFHRGSDGIYREVTNGYFVSLENFFIDTDGDKMTPDFYLTIGQEYAARQNELFDMGEEGHTPQAQGMPSDLIQSPVITATQAALAYNRETNQFMATVIQSMYDEKARRKQELAGARSDL